MKIVAILESDLASGGGFNQALSAVVQMRDLCRDRYEFEVLTTLRANESQLKELGISADVFSFSVLDKILSYLSVSAWWHPIQARIRLVGSFEKGLLRRGCDLVYFVAPSFRANALQKLNFITTVWDLCHRDTPEFPEVREHAEFRFRERLYRSILPPAVCILTDSTELSASLSRRYGVDPERLLAMPFSPAPVLSRPSGRDRLAVLAKYELEEGYFFYPAQLWGHKNHVRVLQALQLLKNRGHLARAVFAGRDAGNQRHLARVVDSSTVRERVRFLGFVPGEDLRGLYEGARAVVMPTYFGPTNLPPLEAWSLGRPLICSTRLKGQVGDAAICVDPDDDQALAHAMLACIDDAVCAQLVEKGHARLREIEQERASALSELERRLRAFEAKRACWE